MKNSRILTGPVVAIHFVANYENRRSIRSNRSNQEHIYQKSGNIKIPWKSVTLGYVFVSEPSIREQQKARKMWRQFHSNDAFISMSSLQFRHSKWNLICHVEIWICPTQLKWISSQASHCPPILRALNCHPLSNFPFFPVTRYPNIYIDPRLLLPKTTSSFN